MGHGGGLVFDSGDGSERWYTAAGIYPGAYGPMLKWGREKEQAVFSAPWLQVQRGQLCCAPDTVTS